MGTLAEDLIADIRLLIPEHDPVEWTDVRILRLLNLTYKAWAAQLGQIPGPGWFTVTAEFTLPANETEYDLTGLTIDGGLFAAIKTIWYLPPNGSPLLIESAAKGQEEMYRLGVGQSPFGQMAPMKRWLSRPGGVATLNLHPESNVARDFRGHFRYEPDALEEGDEAQTDPRHDDVLVMGTALRALKDVGEDDPSLRRDLAAAANGFLTDERNAAGEFESETTKVIESDAVFGEGRFW